MDDYLVAALYRFVALPDYQDLKQPLLNACSAQEVVGTLLLASEGINGTIAGSDEGIRTVIISGVPKENHSKTGYQFGMNSATKMNLDDTTIDALAAYIHSLSQ